MSDLAPWRLKNTEDMPAVWGQTPLQRAPPPEALGAAGVRAELLVERHHVPLLPAVPRLPHLLGLALQRAAVHEALLLLHREDTC